MKGILGLLLCLAIVNAEDVPVGEESMLDTAHHAVVETLNDGAEALPEGMAQDSAKQFADAVEKDGTNINFMGAARYMEIYPISNKPIPDGEMGSDRQYIVSATAGVVFLPNTYQITLSYTGAIKTSESWLKTDEYHVLDEGKKDLEVFEFYARPIDTAYGSLGLGYSSYTVTVVLIGGEGSVDAVDNVNVTLDAGIISNNPRTARIQAEASSFYLTYTLPRDIDYVPNGLSLKFLREESDLSRNLTAGKFILHPDTTSYGISAGIDQTMSDLKSGVSFKKLMYSRLESTHKYYDRFQAADMSLDTTAQQFDIEIAFMWKTETNKSLYLLPRFSMRTYSDVNEEFVYGGLEAGFSF